MLPGDEHTDSEPFIAQLMVVGGGPEQKPPLGCFLDIVQQVHGKTGVKFPLLTVKRFRSQLRFHDRFYIVEHDDGQVRGVFGPSMNGLSDTDIVLIGKLEFPRALETLRRWFDQPSSSRKKPRGRKSRHQR